MALTIKTVALADTKDGLRSVGLQLVELVAAQQAPVQIEGIGTGIAAGSCWAALAVQPSPKDGFPEVKEDGNIVTSASTGLGYSVVFGQSRMAVLNNQSGGHLIGYEKGDGGHAERAALNVAHRNGLKLHDFGMNNYVLYVLLAPCKNCASFIVNKNPYAALSGVLHVVYLFSYPPANDDWIKYNALDQTKKAEWIRSALS